MRITVIGAGNWGTTIALLLSDNGHKINLYEFFSERASEIKKFKENKIFLPGYKIPDNIFITSKPDEAVMNAEMVIFVTPSFALRKTAQLFKDYVNSDMIGVSAVKGIEKGTKKRMSEVILEELPQLRDVAVLSGPTIAREVVKKMPTSAVVGTSDSKKAKIIQNAYSNDYFRLYRSNDKIGVELGGALKNIIAIASGVCDGLSLGMNTKSALITRGLAEIKRLGVAMGGRQETFFGLSGVGDLVVTSFSKLSRNHKVGEKIGKGEKLDNILNDMVEVAEGVYTTGVTLELAKEYNVEMPITQEIYNVLFLGKSPVIGIKDLMMRKLKKED